MTIQMPQAVCRIIGRLEENGFEAYAVGGCVRDALLQKEPNDWDITTSAAPDQVKKIFKRTVDTGIEHGTVTVLEDGECYEVTTYRVDGEYEDSRHPKEVRFTSDLREDLKRRDFTINAMAYNERRGLVDEFCGEEDLKNGVIQCVGDPMERFGEDALRILRAFRFSAQLGFEISTGTRMAAAVLADTLQNISVERIAAELVKMLVSPHPEVLLQAWKAGITAIIMPEWDEMMRTEQNNPHHSYSVGEHTLEALKYVEPDKVLRLAVLCHDFGKPAARTRDENGWDNFYGHAHTGSKMAVVFLKRLKFDNHTLDQVEKLVQYHDLRPEADYRCVRRAMYKVGEELFLKLLSVQNADVLAQSDYQREEKQKRIKDVTRIYRDILDKKQCLSLKDLAVTGKDLTGAGMMPGRLIGTTLQCMLEAVIENPDCNEKGFLMEHYFHKN